MNANTAVDPEFEALLNYVKRSRGFDFTGYKRPSLMRRFRKRMQMLGIEAYSDYVDYFEVHPEEFGQLFDTILINVTTFFRDLPAWNYIRGQIIPQILASKGPDDPIRVWSAGCATGEEPYSVAMLLADALGIDACRERVKIYASDVDDGALAHARQAIYDARAIAAVPHDLAEKYFVETNGRCLVNKDLRRAVIFGRLDLIQDAPISRIDLLLCRNVLMYFNAETQYHILTRFHFALNADGYLFLGKAEMLGAQSSLFSLVDLKCRLFSKIAPAPQRDRTYGVPQEYQENSDQEIRRLRFREAAFDASTTAQVAVDSSGFLVLANERARALLGLSPTDIGRPLQDLDLSYRITELRTQIREVYSERRPGALHDFEWVTTSGEVRILEINVLPLLENGDAPVGVSITFMDITSFKRLQTEMVQASEELETAYEELQSSNEELQSAVEEMETTNEELQSTNEELETTNEELQSINEELETMNEELQSTNEELQTTNQELRLRTEEVNRANAFLDSILSGMHRAVIVLDMDFNVQIWSDKAQELWGLRAEEVRGRSLLNLDIGLPVEQLKQPVLVCLDPSSDHRYHELEMDGRDRRGNPLHLKASLTSLYEANKLRPSGVTLIIEELR